MKELSPMMKQYLEIKNQYKDTILFFRMGDFYEMFFEDAEKVSEELDLTLTGKNCGQEKRAPMCGVPYHSCESYISRLVKKGYKVAMCDQIGDPTASKGLVKREVVRVITPGTVIEESILDESENNYISSCFFGKNAAGITFCDVSTGELKSTEIFGDITEIQNKTKNELGKFCPKEILVSGNFEILEPLKDFMKEKLCCKAEVADKNAANFENALQILGKHFSENKLKELKLEKHKSVASSLGALLDYLKKTQKNGVTRLNTPKIYTDREFMSLDLNTIRNLEISETIRSKSKTGSLLWVLDKTKTAMGKRLLKNWVQRPLMDVSKITARQEAIEELFENIIMRSALIEGFSGVQDIERLMTRITYGSANARDLRSLSSTLAKLPGIKNLLSGAKAHILKKIHENIDLLSEIKDLIENSIVEEPAFSVREGGIIKEGFSPELDELLGSMNGSKGVIVEIERRERERTGISKLKVGYNRIFGYYIEVSNSYKKMVPADYTQKQTLTGAGRYITEELKELETKILYAKDKSQELEYQIFEKIRNEILKSLEKIVKTANVLALLDVLASLGEVATKNGYIKPEVNLGDEIIIEEGRHPVVEVLLKDFPFVPNSALLDGDKNLVSIITGPNMAGKSTFMRQTALIVLMAQMGAYVPAKFAKIGIVDSIFTRIGASDDLSSGQSTFMIEMNEVAEIIKNSTKNSLLILDEIGRGTSTFDGMSIAKAILEYVADAEKCGAKTLFATHYHELTAMSEEFPSIKNYNIAVKKRGDDITFLRRIVPGPADDSYGIEVAKLAGVPEWITVRAKEILKGLESDRWGPEIKETKKTETKAPAGETEEAMKIFKKLKNIDVNVLTPIESMNLIFELAKMAKE